MSLRHAISSKKQTGKDSGGVIKVIPRLVDLFDSMAFQCKPIEKKQMPHRLACAAIKEKAFIILGKKVI